MGRCVSVRESEEGRGGAVSSPECDRTVRQTGLRQEGRTVDLSRRGVGRDSDRGGDEGGEGDHGGDEGRAGEN